LLTLDSPYPQQGAAFGCAVASPGDVDGDKIPDFAIGAAGQSIMDKVAVGRVYIFLSQSEHAEAENSTKTVLNRETARW